MDKRLMASQAMSFFYKITRSCLTIDMLFDHLRLPKNLDKNILLF